MRFFLPTVINRKESNMAHKFLYNSLLSIMRMLGLPILFDRLNIRYFENATKFEKVSLLFWRLLNSIFFKFFWHLQKIWILWTKWFKKVSLCIVGNASGPGLSDPSSFHWNKKRETWTTTLDKNWFISCPPDPSMNSEFYF